jgi:hypothetical protein
MATPEAALARLTPRTDEDGFVGSVDPADLRKICNLYREIQARHPGAHFRIDINLLERVCSLGTDAKSCAYRSSILSLLQEPMGVLSRWVVNGELDQRVFDVAASFPIKWIKPGIPQQGFPLDVQGFIRQVEQATA